MIRQDEFVTGVESNGRLDLAAAGAQPAQTAVLADLDGALPASVAVYQRAAGGAGRGLEISGGYRVDKRRGGGYSAFSSTTTGISRPPSLLARTW